VSFKAVFLISFLCTGLWCAGVAAARPCYPSDPTDNNPDNLCPVFPPPGVNPNTFVQGDARPVRAVPTVPNPSGRVLIDPRGGFWTGVQTQGQTRELETSRNQRYIIRK
jgi:hypothetical protein